MTINKVILPSKEVRYEVIVRTADQKSQIRRRFEKKVDAQEFLDSYKERKKDMLFKGSSKSKFDIENTNFNDEANYWLEQKKEEFTQGYMRVVEPALKRIRNLYGSRPISHFTPELLTDFRKGLKGEGLTASTQNRYTDIILRVIRFSYTSKRINVDPTEGYSKVKESHDNIAFWNPDEIYTFLKYAERIYPRGSEQRWIYVAYLAALETGVRANELWGIKLKDIPLNETKLKISRQHLGGSKFSSTKGKKPRHVPLSSSLKTEIEYILKNEITDHDPEQTLFSTKAGTPIDHDNFKNRIFFKDMEAAKVRHIRFHDLRHTAITEWARNKIYPVTIQKMAGHKKIETTMRYIHLLGDEVEEVGSNHSLSVSKSSTQRLSVVS